MPFPPRRSVLRPILAPLALLTTLVAASPAAAAGSSPLDERVPEAWRPWVERLHAAHRKTADAPEPDLADLAEATRAVSDVVALAVSLQVSAMLAQELTFPAAAAKPEALEALAVMILRDTRSGSALEQDDPAGLDLLARSAAKEPQDLPAGPAASRLPRIRCLAGAAWPEEAPSDKAGRACAKALRDAEKFWTGITAKRQPAAGRTAPAVSVVADAAPAGDVEGALALSMLGKDYRLEMIAGWLDEAVALPRPVTIRARLCGAPGTRWDPAGAEIVVCAELARDLFETALAARIAR